MEIRLNKFLAERLGVSRREADFLIDKNKVQINGKPAIVGQKIKKTDKVECHGKNIPWQHHYTYIILNKPVGYVCSRRAQGNVQTIYRLLPSKYHSLKTVGRLDKDSSGLILLTDDGDFAYSMTHPKFIKTKIYDVMLDTPLPPLQQQMVADLGINLSDGVSKLGLERLDESRKRWRVTMHEGRNRQIRRTFTAVGCEVIDLHRLSFGKYQLGDLQAGKFKEIIV